METNDLAKSKNWKDAGMKLLGILTGMVVANQADKLLTSATATANKKLMISGALTVAGGAGSILTKGFIQDAMIGVTAFGGLKTITNVGALASIPSGVKSAIDSFVPTLAGVGLINAPDFREFRPTTYVPEVTAMNGMSADTNGMF